MSLAVLREVQRTCCTSCPLCPFPHLQLISFGAASHFVQEGSRLFQVCDKMQGVGEHFLMCKVSSVVIMSSFGFRWRFGPDGESSIAFRFFIITLMRSVFLSVLYYKHLDSLEFTVWGWWCSWFEYCLSTSFWNSLFGLVAVQAVSFWEGLEGWRFKNF